MAATYREIAAAIRQRIEEGSLGPGQAVPSTRQITREWGVAMATATKALAALKADGLVRSIPGARTVVADRPRQTEMTRRQPGGGASPRGGAGPELNRERIIRTAVAVADAEGINALTMRRVAVELGVAVMSLYRYVPGKADLVEAMVDHVLGEIVLPDPPPVDWRERIEFVGRAQWELSKRHPWSLPTISLTRPAWTPNGMTQVEWIMRTVRNLGFDAPTSLHVAVVLAGFVIGLSASLQPEADARSETGMSGVDFQRARATEFNQLAGDHFPAMVEVSSLPDFAGMLLDDVFELGLGLILDGLTRRIPSPPGSPIS